MPATPTAQLISELPDTLWTEGVRRLKRVPALWRLAENDETRRAFVEHARSPRPPRASRAKDAALARQDGAGRAPNWRPGPLALVAYAVRHPECQGNAESWLLGAGRETLAAAYATISEDTEALDPLEEALPAALALRLRMTATSDWAALATDAVRAPDRWRLPLQYLWGLWRGSHAAFFAAFMAAGPVAAALAAQCLAVNLAPDEIQEFVAQQNLQLPAGQWLAFTRALEDLGEHACARAILRPIAMATAASAAKSPPPAWNPLQLNITNELESSLLVAATEDYSVAHPVLAAAWTQLRQLRAIVAGHMGRLALKAGDLVVAQAGYQDAFAEMPDNTTYRAGLADVLVKLGRAEEAVVLLQGQTQAEAHLVAAQAHLAIGQLDRAREALAALETADSSQPHTLAAAAHMQADLGDPIAATRLMTRAATDAGSDLTYYLTAAGWLLDRADAEGARAMAIEAAVLAPDSAEARETLGRALLACEQPQPALLHFEAALSAEPGRHTAAAGLARAALAAGQAERAAGAAQGLLDALARSDAKGAPNARLEGEAHTLLGQALSMQSQSEEAFTHFQRASTLVPSAPEPWRAMARHYLAQNDPAQALATLEAGRQALTLQKSAEGAPLLADLAERYVAGGRHAEAILALREACDVDPHGVAHHLRLGSLLRRQGSAADAVEVLKHALQFRPGDGATLYELAQSLENLGRVDEAWSALQQAALTRPAAAEPYLDLGRLTLAQLNKGVPTASPLQAIAALRGAIERAPDLAEAHGLLAQAQQLAGDAQGALESYQSALRLAPSRTDWSLGLGQVCLDLKRPAIAVAALQEALEHHPDHAPVYVALAQAHAACGLWRDSQLAAEAARRLDPDNPLVVQLVAKAAAARGEHQAALAAWREAVSLAPKEVGLQVSLARCLLDAGQADEARQVFAHALETAPGSAEAHLAAGQAYLQLAEVDQAFTVLSEAVQLAPHNAEVQATFAKVAARAGNFEAAHAAYLQAADLAEGPERADYLREAGEALWSINRRAAAVALWQRGVRAYGGDDHGLRARLGLALLELGQNEAALDMLETAAQAHHDTALLRESARAALAVGLLDRASAHLQAAIEQDPGDAEARFMFGVVRDRQSRPEAALQFYQQAARVNPHEGRYLAAAADAWAATGKQKEALEVMQQAVALSPDSGEVQRRAGELFLLTGRTQAAIASFKQFVAAQPRDPSAHLALARSLVTAAEAGDRESRTGQKAVSAEALADLQQQAAEALQQAAALGGDPTLVRYWLGRGKAVAGDPREAQRLLESATLTAGANAAQPAADLFRALGIALRRDGQLDRARDALQTSLQHEGDPALGYLELGLTHAAEGDHSAAAAAYRRAIAAHPDLAEAHYQLGESLAALGEAGEAAAVIQRAIALRPGAAGWHYRLAKLHQAAAAQGDAEPLAAALGHFQRAAELEPDNATYCADLARALAHDGDLHAAAEQFRRATDANRQDAPLWTERGQTHLALGDLKTAAACFGRALELEPAQAAGLLGAARVSLAQGSLHDAFNQAEAAVRAAPEDPQALATLADVNKARGDYAAAERSYTAASVKSARPASALLALGRLYAMQQKWDRALTTLDRAAQADPGSDEILAALGDAQAAAGNPAAAMKTFREAARIAPRQTAHLLRLGRACRALGQLDQALSHLMQAREMDPNDDGVLREIGLVFDQRRQFDRALEMYQLAIAAAPKSSANYTRAGVAYRNLKYYPEAVKALEHAVQLDSKNLEATKQLAVVSAMDLVQSKSVAAQI
jgi:tetratricopeptide (TPR) repeat protein